jgi:phosphoglycolate phosphatase
VPIALETERLFPGIPAALAALREAGHPLAVATGKAHAGAIAACTRLGIIDAVDAVHGILPGTPGKPDPAVLWRALADLKAAPQEAVVVGDSPYDLQMARAAGAAAWAVTWGSHPAVELAAQRPDASFDHLDALLARLLDNG